jgi:hypothetical protein
VDRDVTTYRGRMSSILRRIKRHRRAHARRPRSRAGVIAFAA